jgi:hypothetical protein
MVNIFIDHDIDNDLIINHNQLEQGDAVLEDTFHGDDEEEDSSGNSEEDFEGQSSSISTNKPTPKKPNHNNQSSSKQQSSSQQSGSKSTKPTKPLTPAQLKSKAIQDAIEQKWTEAVPEGWGNFNDFPNRIYTGPDEGFAPDVLPITALELFKLFITDSTTT